ncbi:MAG: cation-efflux pump [Hyphomicrobiaceae bacterium]|nr:MAG: cation-efflux pump [Hyphomicrobiaceae bacterium]
MSEASDRRLRVHLANRKERVALSSIAASAAITVAKLIAGVLSGSLALVSEAAHAFVDTGATILTYLAVRTASKPPDAEHHYGHGKFESLAALAETIVLFVLATIVVTQAAARLMTGMSEFEPTKLAFAVLVLSIIVDLNRVRALRRVARETGSQALAADALHFASDMVGSVLVLVSFLAALMGFRYADPLAALGVALFIAIAGWRLGRRTIDTLLDKAPEGLADRIRQIVAATPGVVEVTQLRIRPGGTEMFAEVAVVVSRTLPLAHVAGLKSRIGEAVAKAHPEVTLTINTVPRALDDETVLERVLITAAQLRTPVHHVTVQNLKDRLSVSVDIEVDGRMSLAAAHAKASKVESALRDELGPDTEVETHIEPLVVKHLEGREAAESEIKVIGNALIEAARDIAGLEEVHDIRVRRSADGMVVNFHCRFTGSETVANVHKAVDNLEREVIARVPAIVRIIGHSEPMKRERGIAPGGDATGQ